MKKRKIFFLIPLILWGCKTEELKKPPLAPIEVVTETYFGKEVADPYRYMENISDSTFTTWLKAQANHARKVLDSIPGRKELVNKMREFDRRKSAMVYQLSVTGNDQYFYLKSTPEDETGKLYFKNGFSGTETLLFDPHTYKKDTLQYGILELYPSPNGKKVAFEVAPNGSENSELMIVETDTGKRYPEVIDRCWLSEISWVDDDRFLYLRWASNDIYDKDRLLNSKNFLHTVGQLPDRDREIFSKHKCPDLDILEEEYAIVRYDKTGDRLFALPGTDDPRKKVYVAPATDLDSDTIHWQPLFTLADEIHKIEPLGDSLLVYTPKKASNFKILKTTVAAPDLENAEITVPEPMGEKIEEFALTSDGLYFSASKNGVEQKLYLLPKGQREAKQVQLPKAAGSIAISSKGSGYPELWVVLSGWTLDSQRYRYDAKKQVFIPEILSSQALYPEFEDLVVKEVMVPSHDGVKVPLSLIYPKNLKKDGNNAVFFLGYGAYGMSMSPFFSPSFLLPTTKGAILAIAHVRGGGELGNDWHQAGRKATKPNTWKDLIACGEYLVAQKYSVPEKMAIYSGSAGGILIGRAMTERPDLFAVAIPEVGSMNTMRMEFTPNGPPNIPEFGTVKDSVECMALYEMDAYHHITDGEKYPATLVSAGMNDPRIIVWEPAKFAARLQAANTSDRPILFAVNFEAGHGIGDGKTTAFEGIADVMGFFLWQTGHPEFQIR